MSEENQAQVEQQAVDQQSASEEYTYNKEPRLADELRTALKEQTPESKEASPEAKVETPVVSEVEKQARALGWKPQGEYTGANYVPPDEYVRRQPLFERIEKQNKEMKELKDLVRQSTAHLSTIRREAYNQAMKELENAKLKAVEEGNTEKYRTYDSEVQALNMQMSKDPIVHQVVPAPELPEDLANFAKRNESWYNSNNIENAKMKAAADSVDAYLANVAKMENKNINIKEHLATIETEVKRLFPHRFETKSEPVASVGKSTVSKSETASRSLISQLTSSQRELGEKFNKSNPKYTLEMYAKDLKDMGRLGK